MKQRNLLLVLVPFVCFFLGYFIAYNFTLSTTQVPSIVGMLLSDALQVLAHHNLNARLIQAKEDVLLPANLILRQTPSAGQQVRKYQTVFLTIIKSPATITIPNFALYTQQNIIEETSKLGLTAKTYQIPSNAPTGGCIGQIPSAGASLAPNSSMIVYCAARSQQFVIMPRLLQLPLEEVLEFLKNHNITPEIIYAPTPRLSLTNHVVQQRPLAGTLIDQSKPMSVQLLVS
jgi:beta-lactam-binding protein with PASTA domain